MAPICKTRRNPVFVTWHKPEVLPRAIRPARNHFSVNFYHCIGCGMRFGRGSDVVRMWVGGGSDVFSDLVQTIWQKLREVASSNRTKNFMFMCLFLAWLEGPGKEAKKPSQDQGIGAKNWRQTLFFLKLFGHPRDIPPKIPRDISPESLVFLGFEGTLWLPPLHVEEPHPTRRYPDQKVWVCAPFSRKSERHININFLLWPGSGWPKDNRPVNRTIKFMCSLPNPGK